jgi:hypothetical protein
VLFAALAICGCDASEATDGRQLPNAPGNATRGSDRTSDTATDEPEVDAPAINIAANDPDVRAPMDATPSPDGARVYYTAL